MKTFKWLLALVPLLAACSNDVADQLSPAPAQPDKVEKILKDYCANMEGTRGVDNYSVGDIQIENVETKAYYFDGKISHEVAKNTRSNSEDNYFELSRVDFTSDKGADGYAYLSTTPGKEGVYYFTPKGEISDTTYNEGLKMVLNNIPNSVGGMAGNNPQIPDSVSQIGTGILIKTTWDQGNPYNKYMPLCTCEECITRNDSNRYYVGCGNVAVAQVIAYWRKFDATFDVNKDINFARLTLNPTPKTPADKDQVAHFLHEVAMRNNTTFRHDGSSTNMSQACEVLRECGYDCELVYGQIEEQTLCSYLIFKRSPVIYVGFRENGGHAWIIDGYQLNSRRQYHCNWGWGGFSDGWTDYETITVPFQGRDYNRRNYSILINS